MTSNVCRARHPSACDTPILALIVVAVWLLGVGTLKDLALVQFVGIMVGTYSSIFFASPLLVTLRDRTDLSDVTVVTNALNIALLLEPAAVAGRISIIVAGGTGGGH